MRTLAPGVHVVSHLPWWAPGVVNSYLVDGDEGVTLIDTGLPWMGHERVRAALTEIGRSAGDVTAILITHAHVDHTGGAAALLRDGDAQVYASVADAPAVRGERRKPAPPVADRIPLLKPLFRLIPNGQPATVDHLVGEQSEAGLPEDFTVLDTPGHTPGHVSYLLQRVGGVLFVGDAAVASTNGTVGRGPMNRPEPIFDASVRHLAEQDFDVACFGHSASLHHDAAAAFRRFAASLHRHDGGGDHAEG